jgi:hypothetical protein
LNEKKYHATANKNEKSNIIIKIHPVILHTGDSEYDYSISVEIYNNLEELIDHKLIRAFNKNGNDITEDASNDIFKYIVSKVKK